MNSKIRNGVTAIVLAGAGLAADRAVSADTAPAQPAAWKTHSEALKKDPSLVRYYLFDEGSGFTVANSSGDGQGALTLLSNSPYGTSREKRWLIWNSPMYKTFTEWTEGRWTGKGAVSSGIALTSPCRCLRLTKYH